MRLLDHRRSAAINAARFINEMETRLAQHQGVDFLSALLATPDRPHDTVGANPARSSVPLDGSGQEVA